MKVALIALIGFAGLSILTPVAKAQQQKISVPLVQTAKLITSPHPGVNVDILGIHIGMTVTEAEAIAAKTYPGKPKETTFTDTSSYRGIFAKSEPYVIRADFRIPDTHNSNNSTDLLTLFFSSPATGNAVVGMYREITFPDSLSAPLMSDVKASLIKKYGPFSIENSREFTYTWKFGKQSLGHCTTTDCVPSLRGAYSDDMIYGPLSDGVDMGITAWVAPDEDKTKVRYLGITIEDFQDHVNSNNVTKQQLNDAAIKYYNKASKSPAVPKL